MNRLARDGIRLERHYVYPTCSPTRAGLLSGRNPSRFGIHSPIAGRSLDSLPAGIPNLAKVLKAKGYFTALSGKWHLGLRPEMGPRQFGFDQTYGYFHGQLDQYTHLYKNGDRTWHRNDHFVEEKGHATDLIADEAIRVIETRRQTPFFLYVAFSVPHYPIQEEENWVAPYKEAIKDPSRRLYAASVTHMDSAISRIVRALENSGQIEETLIIFTSDNGGQRDYSSNVDYEGKHGPYSTLGDNRPLRGWKGELYEGGIRVPAFFHWRGRLKPFVLEKTVSYLDWLPTIAHLVGAKVESSWRLEGRNVWPLLAHHETEVDEPVLYWNTGAAAAVLRGNWKLIAPQGQDMELYNLSKDPAEQTNLSGQASERQDLIQLLNDQKRLDR
jgi:arylsulfatase A-like enzyme